MKKLLLQWNSGGCTTIESAAEKFFNHFKRIWEQEKSTPSTEPITDIEKLTFKVIEIKDKIKKKR